MVRPPAPLPNKKGNGTMFKKIAIAAVAALTLSGGAGHGRGS